jgi:hypothetical protein
LANAGQPKDCGKLWKSRRVKMRTLRYKGFALHRTMQGLHGRQRKTGGAEFCFFKLCGSSLENNEKPQT